MTDIYPIQPELFPSIIGLVPTLLFLIILGFLYLTYKIFSKKIETPQNEIVEEETQISGNINYQEELLKLQNFSGTHREFMLQLSQLFKLFLRDNGYKNILTSTLEEVKQQSDLEEKYFLYFQKIYFGEYRDEALTEEEKKELLDQFYNFVVNF